MFDTLKSYFVSKEEPKATDGQSHAMESQAPPQVELVNQKPVSLGHLTS